MANVPGKIELDRRGRILMTPASNRHGVLPLRVARRLDAHSGIALVEASILTPNGVLVADIAWGSDEFAHLHGDETPFARAPDICIEVASPANLKRELDGKIAAYLGVGAVEAWVVYPESKRIEFCASDGPRPGTRFGSDRSALFD